jgi:predicted acylesterase/phospholipase RssA
MRLGLSLSGGGFRATLYHLGVVRFLHDVGLLRDVTDVVSVSGGSVIAAHLVLNWERYNASAHDFDEAAAELLRLMDVDVRNGIVRRIPFQMPLRWLNALLRRGADRRLTVNGLMEQYLDRYLFGGRSMHELPARPKIHILATSVSEGGLLSFHRDGIHVQKRRPGQPDEMEYVPAQLAPISMAVAASAAFPGFFPPVQIRAQDVGAPQGQFPTQSVTDGGVYDNLGVRAYHWYRRLWMEQNQTIAANELDLGCLTVLAGVNANSPAPLRWLASRLPESLRSHLSQPDAASRPELLAELSASLENVLKLQILHQQPEFAEIKLEDKAAVDLLADARAGRTMLPGNQAWLNRRLLETALEGADGRRVLPAQSPGFDEVLVSDAGQPFLVLADRPNLGFLAQSMRASDILWDRVWQLEQDTFSTDPMFRFVPINRIVSREADPTALHPVVQAEVPMIRTDLDRFTPLESRALIMHGYEVTRAVFAHRIKDPAVRQIPPWDPFAKSPSRTVSAAVKAIAAPTGKPLPAPETGEAKSLQRSSQRRVWATLSLRSHLGLRPGRAPLASLAALSAVAAARERGQRCGDGHARFPQGDAAGGRRSAPPLVGRPRRTGQVL